MASKIVEEFKRFVDFSVTGFKYNLQVFPDTVTAASLLFALLFQSPPLATLGAGFIFLNFLHPKLAEFTTRFVSNTVGPEVDPQLCSGQFPGISYDRLMGMSSERTFGALNRTGWPSFYSVFLGYLVGWIGALPLIYKKEIDASPRRKGATTLGLIVLGLIVLIAGIFRVQSECESLFGLFIGLLVGLFVGGLLVIGVAWISERRMTNILGLPLIRGRATDGKPIYVCERK
jgi:hypothetical protein